MRRFAWIAVLTLAGCSAVASQEPATPSDGVTLPGTAAADAPTPSASVPLAPLDAYLPVELAGIELHTFAVGQDILERMAASLGTDAGAFDARYASEHGARFIQMYAIRLAGADGLALLDALAASAYSDETTDVEVREETIGTHEVTVIDAPSARARIGTFYAYALGSTLVVVQAFEPDDAAEALAALP